MTAFLGAVTAHAEDPQLAKPPKKKVASSSKKSQTKIWTFDYTLSSDYDSNLQRLRAGPKQALGFYADLGIHYRDVEKRPNWKVDYDVAEPYYSSASDLNRLIQHFKLANIHRLSRKATLNLIASGSINDYVDERSLVSDYKVGSRVEYDVNEKAQLNVYAGFREKDYVNDKRFNSRGQYAEVSLDQKFRHSRLLTLGFGNEQSHANDEKFNFNRNSYFVNFDMPLTPNDRLIFKTRMQEKFLYNRLIHVVGEPREPRSDHLWKFGVEWDHHLSKEMDFTVRYTFEQRMSNDFTRDYGDHQIFLSLKCGF